MHLDTKAYLICPQCGSESLECNFISTQFHGEVLEGTLDCQQCKTWYRIENGILDLLPLSLRRYDLYERFAAKYHLPLSEITNQERDKQKANQQDYFNEDADDYEARVVNRRFSRVYDYAAFLDWLDRNKENLSSPVLEIGCGTGRQSIPMAQLKIRSLAGDISEEMLAISRKKIEVNGLTEWVDLIVFDGENPPVKPGVFHACIFYGVLHHIKRKPQVISNAVTKLVNGGLFYSLDPHKSPVRPIFDLLMRIWKIYHEEAADDPLLTSEMLQSWLAAAGVESKIRLIFYLPPHIYNYISYSAGIKLLKISDRIFGSIPLLRNFAGIIIAEGKKIV